MSMWLIGLSQHYVLSKVTFIRSIISHLEV